MFAQRCTAAQSEPTREQLFTERSEILLTWALQITNQQRDAAEDLVQDAFVQFMLDRTHFEEIENTNGYLRRLLRLRVFSQRDVESRQCSDPQILSRLLSDGDRECVCVKAR